MARFESIALEKGMYSVPGKTFTQVLEELDGVFCQKADADHIDQRYHQKEAEPEHGRPYRHQRAD